MPERFDMSDMAIRTKIKEIIERVPDRGPVHLYGRWSADWPKFLAQFQDQASKRILGWEITRRSAPGQYLNTVEEQVDAQYKIRGYMGLQDADQTELLFNTMIDLIREEFRKDMAMGGQNLGPQGFNVETIDERSFGGVLCHYCEIIIPITSYNPT